MKFTTLAIHAGQEPDRGTGADHDAGLPDLDLRPGGTRKEQAGTSIRASPTRHGRRSRRTWPPWRRGHARDRLRLRHRGRRRDAPAVEAGGPHRVFAERVRRDVPDREDGMGGVRAGVGFRRHDRPGGRRGGGAPGETRMLFLETPTNPRWRSPICRLWGAWRGSAG